MRNLVPAVVALALLGTAAACGSPAKAAAPTTTGPTATAPAGTAPDTTPSGPTSATTLSPPAGTARPTGPGPPAATTAEACRVFRTFYDELRSSGARRPGIPRAAEALLRAAVAGEGRPGGPALLSDAAHVVAYVGSPGFRSGGSVAGAAMQKMQRDCSD